jgi:hypothetical protein
MGVLAAQQQIDEAGQDVVPIETHLASLALPGMLASASRMGLASANALS